MKNHVSIVRVEVASKSAILSVRDTRITFENQLAALGKILDRIQLLENLSTDCWTKQFIVQIVDRRTIWSSNWNIPFKILVLTTHR